MQRMRLSISLILFSGLLSLCFEGIVTAQPAQAQQVEISNQSNGVEAAPLYASPTTQDRAGRIVAPVTINGRGPFRFLIDTGANTSVLSPRLVKELGLVPDGQSGILVSGVTGKTTVGSVSIATLEVGELKMHDLVLPVIGSALAGVDGILGVDGFADLRLTVDFEKDSVKVERSNNKRAPAGFTTMPAQFRHGRLVVIATVVGAIRAKAVIDTGAEGTLGNESLRQAVDRRFARKKPGEIASVEGVTADVQYGDVIRATKIDFNGIEIEDIDVAYGPFHVFELWDLQEQPALLIGMDVLGTADVLVIDYRRREVQVKPRTKRFLRHGTYKF
jgi:predicted aspartyl protease